MPLAADLAFAENIGCFGLFHGVLHRLVTPTRDSAGAGTKAESDPVPMRGENL
jgi:hypothetical protein